MKKALVTGITGQDGAYLTKFLLDMGYEVIGISRNVSKSNIKNLKYLGIDNMITLIEVNLLDWSNIIRIIEKNEPDEVYNLAAQSSVGLSFDQPVGTLEFNTISVANLLEAIRIVQPKIKFYQASSSEMFGNVRKADLDFDRFVEIDESLYRPLELEIIYGDNSRAKKLLGWKYDMTFRQLIDTLVNDEIEYVNWEIEEGIKNG